MLAANNFSSLLWDTLNKVNGDEGLLRSILYSLSRDELIMYYKEFRRAMRALWDEFDANGQLRPGPGQTISEDTKEDIFACVVSHGRDYFDEIVAHPERIRADVEPDDVPFLGLPGQVFSDRFDDEITLQ